MNGSALCSVRGLVCGVQYVMCGVQCAVCSVQCAACNIVITAGVFIFHFVGKPSLVELTFGDRIF